MKTVLDTIRTGTPYLEKAGIDNPRLNMEHLLAKVLNCRRMQLYMDFDRPLSEAELAPLRDLVKRRRDGVMTTETVVMRASSGTVRWVKGEHRAH